MSDLRRRFPRWIARGATAGALLVLPLTVAPAAVAEAGTGHAARYTITDLGTLGSGDLSVATAVNNAGVVVGYFYATPTSVHGFRRAGGVTTDLGTLPGGGNSWANAVNDAGQVAGTSDRSPGGYGYPVRWSAGGAIQDLGGTITNRLGVGNGIDALGRVVRADLTSPPRLLRMHCLALCAAITRCHTDEDDAVFPRLAAHEPRLRPVIDELVRDHHLVADLMRSLNELLESLRTNPDPDAARLVRGEVDGLAALLESHFTYEEKRLVAALNEIGDG